MPASNKASNKATNKPSSQALIDLEEKFWQAIVDEDADTAVGMLCEPALMVSAQGAMKFDHAGYRRMAEQGTMVLKSYRLSDMEVVFPTDDTAILTYRVEQDLTPRGKSEVVTQQMADSSIWVRKGSDWQCAMHTETPLEGQPH
jgi:ketosteroid isomerase-like protein